MDPTAIEEIVGYSILTIGSTPMRSPQRWLKSNTISKRCLWTTHQRFRVGDSVTLGDGLHIMR